ncbi:hypothetical protein ACFFH2_08410 [Enterococcus devriesei]|nr:hypothetical protein [Enterococcus devriesei]
MEKQIDRKDYTDLIIQSVNISSALKGLQTLLYYFPLAADVKPSDLDQLNGIVSAIAALAEKNAEETTKSIHWM